jgi:phosphohistidine phosphatase
MLKKLYIIRHAKSSWNNPILNDFDRPLNERGARDAPRMGKRLKEKQIIPDLILSSPAKRAVMTSELIAHALNYPLEKIKTDKKLYHADDDGMLNAVKFISNKYETVLIFGHNPGLTDFVNHLTDSNIDNIPTCGIAACSFKLDSWSSISWGSGELEFFDFPKNKE